MLPRKLRLLDLVVLFTLLTLTFFAWRFSQKSVDDRVLSKFNTEVDRLEHQVSLELNRYTNVLISTKALFAASNEVEEGEFRTHAASILSSDPETYKGIYSLSYIVRGDSVDGQDHYFVVSGYSNTSNPITVYGVDLAQDPVRRAAFNKARDSGNPTVYGPVDLNIPGNLRGFVMIYPIYKNGSPAGSIGERQSAHQGFVGGIFVYKNLFDNVLPQDAYPDMDYEIFDEGEKVYENQEKNEDVPKDIVERKLTIIDSEWIIKAHLHPGSSDGVESSPPILILMGGVLVSFLIFGLVFVAESTGRKAGDLAETMTKELKDKTEFVESVLANIPIGIAINTISDGKAIYMNKAFEDIYGWDKASLTDVEEFFNKVYTDPKYREEIKTRIMGDIKSGDPEKMKWDDIKIATKSGETKFVSARNIPLTGQNLMVSTVVDTTERRLTEDRMQKHKEELERTNSLMVGRELKMAELKKEIERLKGGDKP